MSKTPTLVFEQLPSATYYFDEESLIGHFERFVHSSAVDQYGNLHMGREFLQDAGYVALGLLAFTKKLRDL